jgi:hypothetical protein
LEIQQFRINYLKVNNEDFFIVETPIPKANNLKVTIGAAELVS